VLVCPDETGCPAEINKTCSFYKILNYFPVYSIWVAKFVWFVECRRKTINQTRANRSSESTWHVLNRSLKTVFMHKWHPLHLKYSTLQIHASNNSTHTHTEVFAAISFMQLS